MEKKRKSIENFFLIPGHFKIIVGSLIFFFLLSLIGFSYAYFTITTGKDGSFNLVAGDLSCSITSEMANNQVVVAGNQEQSIEVEITNQNDREVSSIITYHGGNDKVEVSYQNQIDDMSKPMSASIKKKTFLVIRNYNAEAVTLTFHVKCGLPGKEIKLEEGEQKVEGNRSVPNFPVLVDGMIPVKYDGTNWVKVDSRNLLNDQWYDYTNQQWANAVTVTEVNRSTYMSAPAGTVISMNDINTMWVWIPRYEYMYTNLGNQYAGGTQDLPGEIKINFISGRNTIPSDSANYKVHPAFNFGGTELSGIWVGKFETTGTLPSTNYCKNESCDVSTVTIKPNVTSLRNQQVASLFYATRSMQTNNASTYGFPSNDSYNIHMAKNPEWGAVAYLSQSKYGKYGNPDYEGVNKEIYQNKSNQYITGSSNGTPGTDSTNLQVSYDKPYSGYGASTTGTIYGIYDMKGGAWEYVMGSYNKYSGYTARSYTVEEARTILGRTDNQAVGIWNSGFNGPVFGKDTDGSSMSWTAGVEFPEEKYFDVYTTSNGTTACNGGPCDGHALSETDGWYNDVTWFISASAPWFVRGGYYEVPAEAGIFSYSYTDGRANIPRASRAVFANVR